MKIKEFQKLTESYRVAFDIQSQIAANQRNVEKLKKEIADLKERPEQYNQNYNNFTLDFGGSTLSDLSIESALVALEHELEQKISLIEVLQAKFEAL